MLLARFTPDNADYLPTGEVTEVEGTEYDLRRPALLAQAVPRARAGEGFCVNFCVGPDRDPKKKDTDQGEVEDGLALVASLAHPPSGRRLEVWSDQPGLELYTANFLPRQDGLQGKEGAEYCRWGGVCLMTGNYRDPANHAGFPSCELRPDQLYTHRAQYRFT